VTDATLRRIAGAAIVTAAVTGAAMTAAEIVTAPYNPHATLLAWDGPVHLVKYLAMLTLLVSLPAAFVVQRASAGRLGFAGLVLILFGLGTAGTPYNVLEMTLDPSQPIPALRATFDQLTSSGLLGVTAGIGFLGVMVGIILFALASRRAGGVVRTAATVSLISLGVALLRVIAMDALPGVIPHPPTWMLLGLAAYGIAVLRVDAPHEAAVERPSLVHDTAGA
jgi:hypothetical protein